jgi:hypothetical protein
VPRSLPLHDTLSPPLARGPGLGHASQFDALFDFMGDLS